MPRCAKHMERAPGEGMVHELANIGLPGWRAQKRTMRGPRTIRNSPSTPAGIRIDGPHDAAFTETVNMGGAAIATTLVTYRICDRGAMAPGFMSQLLYHPSLDRMRRWRVQGGLGGRAGQSGGTLPPGWPPDRAAQLEKCVPACPNLMPDSPPSGLRRIDQRPRHGHW